LLLVDRLFTGFVAMAATLDNVWVAVLEFAEVSKMEKVLGCQRPNGVV